MIHIRSRARTRWLVMTVAVAAMPGAKCNDGGPMSSKPAPVVGDILGQVTGSALPQEGVKVTLSRAGTSIRVAVTDEHGDYKFLDLEPGEYTVTISEIVGMTCYRNRSATVVAGHGTTADFACTKRPTGLVAGRVMLNGFKAPGFVIDLREAAELIQTKTTDMEGSYAFLHVDSGLKSVTIHTGPYVTCLSTQKDVSVPSDAAARADFTCTGQVLTGQLTVDRSAKAGVIVTICQKLSDGECGGSFLAVTTDYNGRYSHTNLAPGNYRVIVDTPPATTCTLPQAPVTVDLGETVTVDISCSSDVIDPCLGCWDY